MATEETFVNPYNLIPISSSFVPTPSAPLSNSFPVPAGLQSSPSPESTLAGTPLQNLPIHVQQLLMKGRISSTPCCLSPYRCVLTRHPIHRDATESHVASLVARIRESGFDDSLSSKSPLIAVRYSKLVAIPTKAAGSTRTMVQQSWGDHPLVYVISGASRAEAVGQLVQREGDHPNIRSQQKGLGFYLINCGENLTPWDIFLLSTSLNSVDPNSRSPSYFERTDQIAFICLELSNRKECDATVRDIAIEICFNPFLIELRQHLSLSPSIIPLHSVTDSTLPQEIVQELIRSRLIFPYLPPGMGVLVNEILLNQLEVLDVLIDMATCVNSDRMKRVTPEAAHARQKEALGSGATASAKTEGFLHPRAEDQLRHLFKEIVPLESAFTFDVLVLRDLVGVVFGAIQECSRQFRQTTCCNNEYEDAALGSGNPANQQVYYSASNPVAAAYWIERLVYEAAPCGTLAGLWNFPAAALVILFYIYFVNKIQQYNKSVIQENILRLGTVLYRCVAELSLSLRASKLTFVNASTPIQIRVLEAAAMLFRMAFFGIVKVQVFPLHPFPIPPNAVVVNAQQPSVYPTMTFSDIDSLYEFLYSHWLRGIITARLPPTMEYREMSTAPSTTANVSTATSTSAVGTAASASGIATSVPTTVGVSNAGAASGSNAAAAPNQQAPAPSVEGGEPNQPSTRRRHWYESKRLDVAATANRLKQEVEAIMTHGTGGQNQSGNVKVRVKRLGGKRGPPGSKNSDDSKTSGTHKLAGSVEVEVIDPSILPMAQPARLEFLSLVFGVTSMLIEKHQCLETSTTPSGGRNNNNTQFLNVPANMIVLAAIKVALSLIPPHFDRLAPGLVHWVDVRCRLIEWMWQTSRQELCRRAEEKWIELWAKRNKPNNAPKLEVRFTSHRQDGGANTELTVEKLSGLVPEILPAVLESMTAFYEQRTDMPDEKVIRDFFSRWLKSGSGEVDLISQVNQLLIRPSVPSSAEHVSKKPRYDNKRLELDYLRVGHPGISSDPVNRHQGGGHQSGKADFDRVSKQRSSKRPYLKGDVNEELAEWLESLPYTEKLRLNSLNVPEWELPHTLKSSPTDLLRWKPPELVHPFSGNGLRGPGFDPNEVIRIRHQNLNGGESASDPRFHRPLSDLDWKVTEGVLKLLRSRGIDTLVSRAREQVFFIDHMLNSPDNYVRHRHCHDSDTDGDEKDNDRRKKTVLKKTTVDAVAQKRYGASFFKPTDPPDIDKEVTERLFDLSYIRSFLEFDNLFSTSTND